MNNGNIMQALQQIRANPAQFLAQRGIQIPQGMNDPNAILQQLMSSGRFTQQQINQAYQMAQQLKL